MNRISVCFHNRAEKCRLQIANSCVHVHFYMGVKLGIQTYNKNVLKASADVVMTSEGSDYGGNDT